MSQYQDDDILWKVILFLIALPFTFMARAWALAVMWAWFVVPLGVPSIGWAHAFGLATTVGIFMSRRGETKQDEDDDHPVATAMVASLLGPVAVVGMGWCAHAFM